MFQDNPVLGKGIGSFSINYRGEDIRDYPHNIILETASELGIVGLSVLFLLLLYGILNAYKNDNLLCYSVFLCFVFMFLNANVSGDFNDNRLLFTFLALLFVTWHKNDIHLGEGKRSIC